MSRSKSKQVFDERLFLPLEDESQLLSQEGLQTLTRLAASENTDLQMTAAMYYLHVSHHCE